MACLLFHCAIIHWIRIYGLQNNMLILLFIWNVEKFVMSLHNLPPNTNHITHRHLEIPYQFFLSSRHSPVLTSDDFHSIFPPSPPLLPLPVLHPLWWHISESITWCHLNHVFTYIYCLVIEKDICDSQNVSVKFQCVYVCLSLGDLFIFLVRVSSFFSYSCLSAI